jgi:hypothetical protein
MVPVGTHADRILVAMIGCPTLINVRDSVWGTSTRRSANITMATTKFIATFKIIVTERFAAGLETPKVKTA